MHKWRRLFQTTKIQTFESNSQPADLVNDVVSGCFRLQRYKLLKAIHNVEYYLYFLPYVVSDYKDTNFWKQFTTGSYLSINTITLFQTTKIQTFESNSQRSRRWPPQSEGCFRLQRYKLLKAIHNEADAGAAPPGVVSDYKDTNFWKQFTTKYFKPEDYFELFQTTKIQTFESNSQRPWRWRSPRRSCFRLQRYKLLKAIHNRRNLGQNTWHQQDDCN